jgi:hypothetical protein
MNIMHIKWNQPADENDIRKDNKTKSDSKIGKMAADTVNEYSDQINMPADLASIGMATIMIEGALIYEQEMDT